MRIPKILGDRFAYAKGRKLMGCAQISGLSVLRKCPLFRGSLDELEKDIERLLSSLSDMYERLT
jgi:hypothetical protein